MREEKNRKAPFEDDGRVIARMDLPGMPGVESRVAPRRPEAAEAVGDTADAPPVEPLVLSREERRAMRRAAWIVGVQTALLAGAILTLSFFLVWLWIH